jgi:hypothetical protein
MNEQLTFWGEKLQWKLNGDLTDDNQMVVRVKGQHYIIHHEPHTDAGFKGHGGREFDIEFIDGPHKGKRVKSKNVWCQGEIENDYLEVLPDNAVFHWDTTPLILPSEKA